MSASRETMPSFESESLEIFYQMDGEGDPVLLIHGFASNSDVNWIATGWVKTLADAGYKAITMDNRGHGKSEKPHDIDAYHPAEMAKDVLNLMDHLNIGSAPLLGYSMGARIAAFAASSQPDRVEKLIMGGIGMNLIEGMKDSRVIIEGLKAGKLSDVTDKTARQFRIFAEHTGSDLKALAACMEGSRKQLAPEDAAALAMPALIVLGEDDEIAGSGPQLAGLIPHADLVLIPRRDHMRTTGDPVFKQAVLDFLSK